MNLRLYTLSFADVVLIVASLFTDIDPILRSFGLLVGVIVGILTAMKLWQDFKIRKEEYRQLKTKNKQDGKFEKHPETGVQRDSE